MTTAKWIPPSLCGCEFNITGTWDNPDDIVNGVTQKHPKPFSITAITLLKVCNKHKTEMLKMPDVSPLYDKDLITGELKQNRGYIKYPIANPTPAEILYTFFYFHKGHLRGYSCGCRAFMHTCNKGIETYIDHPKHTVRCYLHQDDDVCMSKAKIDHDKSQLLSG